MRLMNHQSAPVHSARFPDSPQVTVLFGGDDDGSDIGMVRVGVPAGAGMPAHRHSGSDVILTPITGAVRVTKDEQVVDLGVGQSLLILKDEAVALTNPHQEPAELTVAAGPAAFISTVRGWPLLTTEPLTSA